MLKVRTESKTVVNERRWVTFLFFFSSSDEFVKGFSHNEQLNPFSPVWILEWTFTWLVCAKDFVQLVQLNGFSPVWILEWTFRWMGCAKDFLQI